MPLLKESLIFLREGPNNCVELCIDDKVYEISISKLLWWNSFISSFLYKQLFKQYDKIDS